MCKLNIYVVNSFELTQPIAIKKIVAKFISMAPIKNL